MLDIDEIYMTHYTPLVDRKQSILKNIPFKMQWIESEPERKYWTTDIDNWNEKVIPRIPYRQLNKAEISLSHKHIEVYKDMVRQEHQRCLVLEDDVVLDNNFEELFNHFIANTPQDWDFIFIGSGCDLRIPQSNIISNQIAYKVPHPASKCTDSYCLTLSAAKKILETIIPFTFPIDFELNYQMKLHNMNVYWWEPPLVRQGSQCGIYTSSIR